MKPQSAQLRPRRFVSPAQQLINAKLEPIHQPLYSTFITDQSAALPSSMGFFQYAVGNKVATNAALFANSVATKLHTNMEQAGALATPKMFLIQGIRVVVNQLPMAVKDEDGSWSDEDTLANSGHGGSFANAGKGLVGVPLVSDLKNILYGTYFNLHVGSKDYLTCPTYLVPGNVGVETPHQPLALQTIPVAAGTAKFVQLGNALGHSIGRHFSLGQYPILIPSQQSFNCSLEAPATPTMNNWRQIQIILEGILGREVQ